MKPRLNNFFVLFLMGIIFLSTGSNVFAETDVTDKVQLIKSSMRYDRRAGQTFFNVSVKNTSQDILLNPVKVIIEDISDQTVSIANADGITDAGKPFYEYKSEISINSNQFNPLQQSDTKKWIFKNPQRKRFSYIIKVLGSEYVSTIIPAFNYSDVEYDLGGEETLNITTMKYSGQVEIPSGSDIQIEELIIDSGIAGETAISDQGHFIAEMNTEATTLMTVRDNHSDYFMCLFPKSNVIIKENPVINAMSTASALIAFQAGLVTGEPEIDALFLAIINNLDETIVVANQIEAEIKNGTFDLKNSFSPNLLLAMQNAIQAINTLTVPDALAYNTKQHSIQFIKTLIASMEPTSAWAEWPVDNSCTDSTNDKLADLDGIDRDGVCLTGTIGNAGEPSTLNMENTLGRWVLLAVPEENGNLDWIDWVPPRNRQLPGVSDLLSDLLSLSWAGSKDFLHNIFKQEQGTAVEEKLKEILEGYQGNSISTKNYTFQNAKSYDVLTLGSHKKLLSEPYKMETGTSFVLGTVSEVILPFVSVVMEVKSNMLKKSIKDSISNPNCKTRMADYVGNLKMAIEDVMETYVSHGIREATKVFALNIVKESLLEEDGVMVIACLTKNVMSVQKVRAVVVKKIAKYVGTGSVAFWIDVANSSVASINCVSSIDLFIESMADNSISPIDHYTANVADYVFHETFENGLKPDIWNWELHNWRGQKTIITENSYEGNSCLFMKGSDWFPGGCSMMENKTPWRLKDAVIKIAFRDAYGIDGGGGDGAAKIYLMGSNGQLICSFQDNYDPGAHSGTPGAVTKDNLFVYANKQHYDTGIKLPSLTGWHTLNIHYQSAEETGEGFGRLQFYLDDSDNATLSLNINSAPSLDSMIIGALGQYHNTGEWYIDDIKVEGKVSANGE